MTTTEINILIALRKAKDGTPLDVTKLAAEIGESRVQVSQVINYERPNKRVRRQICFRLGVPYEEMWGEPDTEADQPPQRATGTRSRRASAR